MCNLHHSKRNRTADKVVTDPLMPTTEICVVFVDIDRNIGSMIVFSLALLLLLGEGLGDDLYKSPATRDSSSLLQRMETLESLVQRQGAQLALQGDMLHQQQALLHVQSQKISSQQSLLLRQETQLRKQNSKLSQQGKLLTQCRSRLFALDLASRKQDEQLAQLLGRPSGADNLMQKHPNTSDGAGSSKDMSVSRNVSSVTDILKPWAAVPPTSTHDVSARADDAGPLETVVGQLSQRVTEMDADMQAWKTQTDSDIQTLRTTTAADIQTLQTSNLQQDHDIQDAATSTFVHWGSSQCSNASQLVYSGVVGGSWYDHSGAATNYLCLTMSPVFSSHPSPSLSAYLYGGEYQTEDSHDQKDPLCAVCRSTYSTTIMIPGTNVCTAGWQLQYSGFLMAGVYDHTAGSEYICVDSRLENGARGDQNENGKLLYFTLTRCGSLPCSPYANDKLVTCAVCSK